MQELNPRLYSPISTTELERRWTEVRRAMTDQGIDVLVMQNNHNCMGGYVRYFTDVPPYFYAMTVIFPREADMTVVQHGPIGGRQEIPPGGNGILRGVGQVLTTASFSSVPYSRTYDAELAVRALEPYRRGTIGLIGTAQMAHAFGSHLEHELSSATFVEASDLVDAIKAIKSDEERRLTIEVAKLQDGALAAGFEAIEPGMRDSDVVAAMQFWSQRNGSEYGFYLCGSAPPGTPARMFHPHLQNRVIEDGDVVTILIENSGPGGFFAELGRTCVLGKAPDDLVEELEVAKAAQRFCLDQMVPGTSSAEVWKAYNAYQRDHDRPEDHRILCHGQGYDLVERPLVRDDEPMVIEEHMNFACHPTYEHGTAFAWICDNYLIEATGPKPIHASEQKIFEL